MIAASDTTSLGTGVLPSGRSGPKWAVMRRLSSFANRACSSDHPWSCIAAAWQGSQVGSARQRVGGQRDSDGGAGWPVRRGLGVGGQRLERLTVRKAHVDLGRRADVHDAVDHRREAVRPSRLVGADPHALGSDDELHGAGRAVALRVERVRTELHHLPAVVRRLGAGVEQIGHAEEVGDVGGGRPLVDLDGRTDLGDLTAVHHGQAVRHRQRLLLVVRDVEERDADIALQRGEVALEVLAQLGVERAEWLVEQEHLRLQHERPGQGHALLLAAGELRRPPLLQPAEADEVDHLADPSAALRLVERRAVACAVTPPPQPVGDVVLDVEVGEEGIRLEHRVDRPAVRRHGDQVLAVEQDLTTRRLLEAGDHPQRRGLAAAGRSEQREELAGLDAQLDVVDGDDVVERACSGRRDRSARRAVVSVGRC